MMNWYRLSQYKTPKPDKEEFLSWFGTSPDEIKADIERAKEQKTHEIVHPPESKRTTLTLYRGFDYLPVKKNGKYLFDPSMSEQETLWFTHHLITRNYDPLEYAKDHGKYLLTYPLEVTKHFQRICYDNNNDCFERIPSEIQELVIGTENCRFYLGYELPEGWFFSYKMEKFIGCDYSLPVDVHMVSES